MGSLRRIQNSRLQKIMSHTIFSLQYLKHMHQENFCSEQFHEYICLLHDAYFTFTHYTEIIQAKLYYTLIGVNSEIFLWFLVNKSQRTVRCNSRCVKVQIQTQTTQKNNGRKLRLHVQLKIHSRRVVELTIRTAFAHKNRFFEVAFIHPGLHLGWRVRSMDIRTLLIPLKFPHYLCQNKNKIRSCSATDCERYPYIKNRTTIQRCSREEGKRLLGRHRQGWKYVIQIHLKPDLGYGLDSSGSGWERVAKTTVNTAVNLEDP